MEILIFLAVIVILLMVVIPVGIVVIGALAWLFSPGGRSSNGTAPSDGPSDPEGGRP